MKITDEMVEAFDNLSPEESVGAFDGSGQWIELFAVRDLRSLTAALANCDAEDLDPEAFLWTDESLPRRGEVTPPNVREQWQDISTAPKDELIDIWIDNGNGEGVRRCDCYYDQICDEWRTSRPSGHLISIRAKHVTHWMPLPAAPKEGQPS